MAEPISLLNAQNFTAPTVKAIEDNPRLVHFNGDTIDVIESAILIASDLLNGRTILDVAQKNPNAAAFGIGSLVHRLTANGICTKEDAMWDVIIDLLYNKPYFVKNKMIPGRMMVIKALRDGGLIPEKTPMKEIKPVGTNPTVQTVCRIVEDCLGKNYHDIVSASRSRDFVVARFMAIWVLREVCGHSLTHIGQQVGNRDHTSIINALDKMNDWRKSDHSWVEQTDIACQLADHAGLENYITILSKSPYEGLHLISQEML